MAGTCVAVAKGLEASGAAVWEAKGEDCDAAAAQAWAHAEAMKGEGNVLAPAETRPWQP